MPATTLSSARRRCQASVIGAAAALYQRVDDTLETARRRLEIYEQDTLPVLEYYRNKGILVEVPGDRSVREVSEALRAATVTQRGAL